MNITPPGVADATTYPLDPTQGPCGQLLRQDGSVVCWGAIPTRAGPYAGVDVWDDNALGRHHETPARGHGYQPPAEPQPTGPETWPAPRHLVPPAPTPIPGGQQLDLTELTDRSTT
jgi:hypothetical protein